MYIWHERCKLLVMVGTNRPPFKQKDKTMTRQSAQKKARQTGKAIRLAKLEQLLGFALPEGSYIPEHAMDTWFQNLSGGKIGKPKAEDKEETDAEIDTRLRERFDAMHQLTELCIDGEVKSLIVSGPAGLGKSYDVEKALKKYDPTMTKFTIISGFSTGTGFFKQLWDHREEGSILIMDDCDIWHDEKAVSLLKAATDTSAERIINYLSEGVLISDRDQSRIPNMFEFQGTLIFITNKDLDYMAEVDTRMGMHFEALMSRGQYVDLTLRNRRDYMVRIRQVVSEGLLDEYPESERKEVVKYVEKHRDSLRALDLRMVLKIAKLRHLKPKNWESLCKITCFRA